VVVRSVSRLRVAPAGRVVGKGAATFEEKLHARVSKDQNVAPGRLTSYSSFAIAQDVVDVSETSRCSGEGSMF